MDRVGGDYNSYLALRENARAYDDVIIAINGESDAGRIRKMLSDTAGEIMDENSA